MKRQNCNKKTKSARAGCVKPAAEFEINGGCLKKYNGENAEVRVPGFVTSVSARAFSGKTHVKSVTLSANVASVGEKAFYNCAKLTEVFLPYGLTGIGKSAFANCRALTDIHFDGLIEKWVEVKKGEGWLEGVPEFLIIYCKDGNVSLGEEREQDSEKRRAREIELKIKEDEKEGYEREFRNKLEAYIDKAKKSVVNERGRDESEIARANVNRYYAGAVRFCMGRGYATAELICEAFPVNMFTAEKIIELMFTYGLVKFNTESLRYEFIPVGEDTEDEREEKKAAAQNLASALRRISEKKRQSVSAECEPSHFLWDNEDEFDCAVEERLKQIALSDARNRAEAIAVAENYLYAVRDTHDGKMMQVYERLVYELKIIDDVLFDSVRRGLRG